MKKSTLKNIIKEEALAVLKEFYEEDVDLGNIPEFIKRHGNDPAKAIAALQHQKSGATSVEGSFFDEAISRIKKLHPQVAKESVSLKEAACYEKKGRPLCGSSYPNGLTTNRNHVSCSDCLSKMTASESVNITEVKKAEDEYSTAGWRERLKDVLPDKDKLEIHSHGDWQKVDPLVFRSWTGPRKRNGKAYTGPRYFFLTDQPIPEEQVVRDEPLNEAIDSNKDYLKDPELQKKAKEIIGMLSPKDQKELFRWLQARKDARDTGKPEPSEQGISFPGSPAGSIPADYSGREKKVKQVRKQLSKEALSVQKPIMRSGWHKYDEPSWDWRTQGKGDHWKTASGRWGARAQSGEVDYFDDEQKAIGFSQHTHKPKDARDLYMRGNFEKGK